MAQLSQPGFRFGNFSLNTAERRLLRRGETVPLTPKVFDTLLLLVKNSGHLVEKEAFLKQLWPDAFVEEASLAQNISVLRKVLGDDGNGNKFIETLPKRGYRFVAEVKHLSDETERATNDKEIQERATIGTSPKENSDGRLPVAAASPLQSRRAITWMASLVLILLLFSAATWLVRHRTAKPADDTSTLSALPFTGYPGVVAGTSFSPDGNQIAFFWDGENDQSDLYVKMIGADSSRRLTSDRAGSGFPAWSPDGVTIAFSRPRSGGGSAILLIPASGGPERKLIDTNASWVGTTLSWSRDAKYLALADRNSVDGPYSLYLMSLETLQRRRLTEAPGASVGDWCPAFSPDGRSLAFVRALNWGRGEIEVLSLDSGKIHTAATDPSWLPGGLTWAPEGKDLIFASARMGLVRLWRVPAAGGEPHVLSIGEGGFAPAVSFRSHRLAYTAGRFNSNIWRTDLAGAAPRHTKVVASARQEGYPELSPDGKKIAFTSDRSGSPEIWTADANGSNQVQLTHFAGPATGSVHWSPDGRQLVFDSHARGQNDVYVSRIDGGSPRLLMAGALDSFHPYWSHDARRIYFASDRTGTTEIWKVPPEGGEPQQVSHHGGYIPYESPDGRFLYFLQPASGQFWSVATSGGEPAPVPGMPPCNANGHLRFAWRPSREGIYFVDIDTKPRPTLKFFRFSTRTLHALAKITNSEGALGLSVSTNGRSFFYGQMDAQATDIMLVDNFR